jgi:hypothetical protein
MVFTTPEERVANRPVLFSGEFEASGKKMSDGWTETTKDEFDNVSIGISDNDFSAKKQLWGSSGKKKGNSMSPEGTRIITMNKFDQRIQRTLSNKMEDRCFELAKRVLDDFPLNSFKQLHMAFAIVKIVRMEFGLNNKVFEENEFLEEIFQIASIDYTYEHDMIRQKYQRLAEPVKSVNSFPTAHEILTKNKHKSMVKISPRNSSQKGKTSTFGQNSQSVNTLINGNKSVAHFRQSSIV